MKKAWLLVFFCVFLLCGCHSRKPPTVRVVTRITVADALHRETPIRSYTDGSKLKKLMHYLRTAGDKAVSPNAAPLPDGKTYLITLHRSDGTVVTYRHHAFRGLYTPRSGWRYMPPLQARRLQLLLAAMPGD